MNHDGHSLVKFCTSKFEVSSAQLQLIITYQLVLSNCLSPAFFGVVPQNLEVREKQYDKKAYLDFFTVSSIAKNPV